MGILEIDFEKKWCTLFLSSSHSITRTILDRIKTNKHLGQDRDQNLVHKLQMLLSKKSESRYLVHFKPDTSTFLPNKLLMTRKNKEMKYKELTHMKSIKIINDKNLAKWQNK